MSTWRPNFDRFQTAISRRSMPDRIPNAENDVDWTVMEAYIGRLIRDIKSYVSFWPQAGYDFVLSEVRGQPIADSPQIRIAEGYFRHLSDEASVPTWAASRITDEKSFEQYPWIGPEGVYYKDLDLIKNYLPDGMKVMAVHGPLFQHLFRIMGIETLSLTMVDNPALIQAMADRAGTLAVNVVESLLQREWVGGLWFGDDLAYTQGLLVSPNFLRKYIFPYYHKIGDLCRRYGKIFIFHSDGRLESIMEDLLACGISAIHPNEPLSVDIVELKRKLGDRLAFVGNVDVDLLARGTPELVAQATRILIEKVGPGGGFTLGSGNSIAPYTVMENYRAMLNTVRDHGQIY
jgi:uroporphyrinogen decarboxylase